jgi:hypothetical protein
LNLAWQKYDKTKWETIAENMKEFGCHEKWPKELVQKKWHELHPEDPSYLPEYELRLGMDQRSWSDGGESKSHSMHEGDASNRLSAVATTPQESRSRTGSDVSSHLQFQQQQQLMFEDQQGHAVWTSGT